MSLATQVSTAFTRVATEFKAIRAVTGVLSNLTTTDKSNLVAAINEIKAATASASGINDSATSGATAWSSSKTSTAISQAVSGLVNSSPATLDTLSEIAAALGSDANFATTMTTALGNRLRVDASQALTAGQKAFGQANLDVPSNTAIGDTNTDFSGGFVTALA